MFSMIESTLKATRFQSVEDVKEKKLTEEDFSSSFRLKLQLTINIVILFIETTR